MDIGPFLTDFDLCQVKDVVDLACFGFENSQGDFLLFADHVLKTAQEPCKNVCNKCSHDACNDNTCFVLTG